MADTAIRQMTPLIDRVPHLSKSVQISERQLIGKITLRGNPDDKAFTGAAASVLGAALPVEPNTTAASGDVTIQWVGPDEWLIHTPPGAEKALGAKLTEALAGQHCAVVDVSDYYTVIRLAGRHARGVLAKGCPLDLHPRSFKPGDCAGTLYFKAAIRLVQIDDAPCYDLQVRWSFADYVWENLVQGAREWG